MYWSFHVRVKNVKQLTFSGVGKAGWERLLLTQHSCLCLEALPKLVEGLIARVT